MWLTPRSYKPLIGPSAEKAPGGGGPYLPTLDGWRAIAIALVLLAHASPSVFYFLGTQSPAEGGMLAKGGLLGVRIFFGLSGFLITSLFIFELADKGTNNLISFYIRRFFRIVPPAFAMLLLAGTLSLIGILPITLGRWLSQLLFFANYSTATHSHFWSLAVEEHFYLIWPIAFVLAATPQRRQAISISMAIIVALWRALDWKFGISGSTPDEFWSRTDIQADCLLWGAAVALLAADSKWHLSLRNVVSSTSLWIGLIFAVLLFGLVNIGDWKVRFASLTVTALAIPLAILGTMWRPKFLPSKMLEGSLLRWIGRRSYSIYLWQQLFLCPPELIVKQISILQVFPLNLLAVFSCAILSYNFIEIPLISLGRQFIKRREVRDRLSGLVIATNSLPVTTFAQQTDRPEN